MPALHEERTGCQQPKRGVRYLFSILRNRTEAGMKTGSKLLLSSVVIIVILIAGLFYYVWTSLDSLVEDAIEKYGSQVTPGPRTTHPPISRVAMTKPATNAADLNHSKR